MSTPVGNASSSRQHPADVIRERLTHFVGPFTARTAVQTFSKQALGVHPDAVTREQVPQLLDALGPLLRTLLGKGAEDVIHDIEQEFHA